MRMSKEPCPCLFLPRAMCGYALSSMTGAIKSWLSCQLKGSEVKLILSEKGLWWATGRGYGAVTCWLSEVWWTGKRNSGGRGYAVCGSHELWRKSAVTRGDSGWLDNYVTTWCSFLKLGKKTEGWKGESESKNTSSRGCSSKDILVQRLRHHSELFENTSVEVKNKSTMRYLARSHSYYATNQNSWNASDHFWKHHLNKFMHESYLSPLPTKPQGQSPTGLRAEQTVSDDTFFSV